MYVVAPWSEFQPQPFRIHRLRRLLPEGQAGSPNLDRPTGGRHLPPSSRSLRDLPVGGACDRRRREDDHLCLVAGYFEDSDYRVNGARRPDGTSLGAPCRCRSIGSPTGARLIPILASANRRDLGGARAAGGRQVRTAAGRGRVRASPAFPNHPKATYFWTSKAIPSSASMAWNTCSAMCSRMRMARWSIRGLGIFTR